MADTGTFDTLETAQALKNAGFDERQAEACARAIGAAVGGGSLVTKEHFDRRLAELKGELRVDSFKLAFGVVAAQTALVAGLFKLIG